MAASERTSLADAARALASAVQANDAATLRSSSTPEIVQNFGAMQYMVAVTSPKLTGATPQVDQVYLLDASSMKPSTDSNPEAQFYCSLNKTTQEVDFAIPGLPPGRYGFAVVSLQSHPTPWRLSMLLRNDSGRWLIAGFYPKPLTIAGHDGLWYWTQARTFAQSKQLWDAWLYYQAAQTLLRPTDFVLSTHLDKLRNEVQSATPPTLSEGISSDIPLVVKSPGAAGSVNEKANAAPLTGAPAEFRFTSLSLADPNTPESSTPMLSVHLRAEALPSPDAARQRNMDAARALVTAYPEMRKPFDRIAVTTESANQPPLTTILTMSEVK
jgi:hypothetical protein